MQKTYLRVGEWMKLTEEWKEEVILTPAHEIGILKNTENPIIYLYWAISSWPHLRKNRLVKISLI